MLTTLVRLRRPIDSHCATQDPTLQIGSANLQVAYQTETGTRAGAAQFAESCSFYEVAKMQPAAMVVVAAQWPGAAQYPTPSLVPQWFFLESIFIDREHP